MRQNNLQKLDQYKKLSWILRWQIANTTTLTLSIPNAWNIKTTFVFLFVEEDFFLCILLLFLYHLEKPYSFLFFRCVLFPFLFQRKLTIGISCTTIFFLLYFFTGSSFLLSFLCTTSCFILLCFFVFFAQLYNILSWL